MLVISFVFYAWLFKKEKKGACYALIFFSTELLFKMKYNMILLLKVKQMVLKYFYVTQLIYIYDSPGLEFFSVICVQFPLTFLE